MEKAIEKEYNRFNERLNQKLSKEQYRDLTSHDLKRINKVMSENIELGQRLRLKNNKQDQHIIGTEQYNIRNDGQSYFKNTTSKALHDFILSKIDMKSIFRHYQFIDIEKDDVDAVHVYMDGSDIEADQIKVHQSGKGIHGVPNKKR